MENLRWCNKMCGSCRVCLPSRDLILDGKLSSVECLATTIGCLFYDSIESCLVDNGQIVIVAGDVEFRMSASDACALLACSIGAGQKIFNSMLVLLEMDPIQFKKVYEYRIKSDRGQVSRSRYMQVRNYALGLCGSCNRIADGTHKKCTEHAQAAIIAARGKNKRTPKARETRRNCLKRADLKKRRAKRGLLPTDLVPTGRPRGGKNKCSVCGVEGHTILTHHRHAAKTS
jgi:hypothetical protein